MVGLNTLGFANGFGEHGFDNSRNRVQGVIADPKALRTAPSRWPKDPQ